MKEENPHNIYKKLLGLRGGGMKKIIALTITICTLAFFPQTAKSQYLKEWESAGPGGRNIVGMAFNPMNPQEIYALISGSSGYVYKTENSGASWEQRARLNSYCYDISADPQSSNILYVLGKHNLFKSEDNGVSWEEYRFGNSCYGINGQICVNPNNPNIMYASGCHYYSSGRSCMALFSSSDGGENWTTQTFDSGSKRGYTTCLSIDPVNPNLVYCGGYFFDDTLTYYYKVYKSSDGGENWSDITGSIDGYPRSIAIDPSDPSNVYIGTTEGIYRSSNGGSSWQKNNGSAYAYALCIDPWDSDILYAGHWNNCYKSEDGGINWTSHTEGAFGSCNIILASSSNNHLFFGSNAGIYKSIDNGLSWNQSSTGLQFHSINAIAIAKSSPNNIYCVLTGSGLFQSPDFGTTWVPRLADEDWCSSLINVKVNPNNENDIFIYPGPAG